MELYKQKKLIIGSLSFLFFMLLAILVSNHVQWFYEFDSFIYQIDWQPNIVLTTMVSYFSKTATIVPILGVSILLSWMLFRKKLNILAFWVTSNVLVVSVLGYVTKSMIARSRPNVDQLIEKTSYSFPSGHSLLSMCLIVSTIVALDEVIKCEKKEKRKKKNKRYKRKRKNDKAFQMVMNDNKLRNIQIGLIAYAILIGLSRIFLRVHYPSDVLAGFLLSLSWVNLSFIFLEKFFLGKKSKRWSMKITFGQKIILGSLIFLLCIVTSVSAYAVNLYNNVQKTADKMYQPLDRESKTVEFSNYEPVSFLLLGIANDSKRKTDYRANTIMVVTVNNQLEQTTITSIPRDAYVEMVGMDVEFYDKINHAHSFGGEEMMIDTVEHFLDIPIHHYFSINMDGLVSLADAVGGVTVDNSFAFDAEGIHYPEGKQHLGGWETLQYARMRYEDPLGDYGRQERQREVTIELMNELKSIKNVFRYQELLDVIGENGQTDMTLNQMVLLMKNYQKALENIESVQMQGDDFIGDGIIGEDGISYQSVTEAERQKIMNLLKEQLDIKEPGESAVAEIEITTDTTTYYGDFQYITE